MLTLYYHPISMPSLGPLFTAEATGVTYKKIIVDLQNGEQRSPEYVAISPFSRVPALKDGDFCLSESAAIMRYLARQSGSALYPDNIQDQARVDQWLDYVVHHIRTPVGRIQFNRIVAPMIGQEPDGKSLAQAELFLSQNLPAVETRLKDKGFLCGNHMSLADIMLVCALEAQTLARLDLDAFPTLTEWLEARRAEDFYQNVHAHFGAELGL